MFSLSKAFRLVFFILAIPAVVSAQAVRFAVYESDAVAGVANNTNAPGTTVAVQPLQAGKSAELKVVAYRADGSIDTGYNRAVTVTMPETRVPKNSQNLRWAKTNITAGTFVGGVATFTITPIHAGTRDRRFEVTDGNIATYAAAENFIVHPKAFVVSMAYDKGYDSSVANEVDLSSQSHAVGVTSYVRVVAINEDNTIAEAYDDETVDISSATVLSLPQSVTLVNGASDQYPLTWTGADAVATVDVSDFYGVVTTTDAAGQFIVSAVNLAANTAAGKTLSLAAPTIAVTPSPGDTIAVKFSVTNPLAKFKVSSLKVSNAGAGYVSSPTVTISGDGHADIVGTGLVAGGALTGFTFPPGTFPVTFNAQPGVSITGGGATTPATAVSVGADVTLALAAPILYQIRVLDSDDALITQTLVEDTAGFVENTKAETVKYVGSLSLPLTMKTGTFKIELSVAGTTSTAIGSFTARTALPDLKIVRLDYAPGEYREGDAIAFQMAWTNLATDKQGNRNLKVPNTDAGRYRVQIHLSSDPIFGNADDIIVWEDEFLGRERYEFLAGQTRMIKDAFKLPRSVPGTFYLLAKVNSWGARDLTNPDKSFSTGFAEVVGPTQVAPYEDGNNVALASEAGKITILPATRTPDTTRVSVKADGSQSSGLSDRPVLSSDGRYIAFHSFESLTTVATAANTPQVYLRDRLPGVLTPISLISIATNGVAGNEASLFPRISSDGKQIVFQSDATNLVLGDTNTYTDVFVRDLIRGRTVRVMPPNIQPNAASLLPDISGTGRYVVFESAATNLVSGVNPTAIKQIWLLDRDTDGNGLFDESGKTAITLLSRASGGGAAGSGDSSTPRISRDGEYVVFTTKATNLIGQSSAFTQVVRWKRSDNTLSVVTRDPLNNLADGDTGYPVINADGSYVVFASRAKNLTADTTTPASVSHLFRAQLASDGSVSAQLRISGYDGSGNYGAEPDNPDSGSFAPDLGSYEPSISDNGNIVAFVSESDNLLPRIPVRNMDRTTYDSTSVYNYEDRSGGSDIYVADLSVPGSPSNQRVSVSRFGFESTQFHETSLYSIIPSSHRAPTISGDARYIVFASDAKRNQALEFGTTNFDYTVTNGVKDIFLYDNKVGVAPDPSDRPVVNLNMPVSLTTSANNSLDLVATVSSSSRTIARVDFYADGVLVASSATETSTGSGRYTAIWNVASLGIRNTRLFDVVAVAVDVTGISSLPSTVTEVTVNPVVGILPSVTVINPDQNISISNNSQILLQANATDPDGTVVKVEFYLSGTLIATAGQVDLFNWQATADLRQIAPGAYTLYAVATDSSSNQVKSATFNLTLKAATYGAPTLAFGFTPVSMSLGTSVPITVTSTPAVGQRIAFTQIYSNGLVVATYQDPTLSFGGTQNGLLSNFYPGVSGSFTPGTAITTSFTLTPDSAGNVTLYARTIDAAGNTRVTAPVTITVNPVHPNQPPALALVGPLGTVGTPFQVANNTPISLVADAVDSDGTISDVTFYVNGSPVGTQTVPAIANQSRYVQRWTPTVPGTYTWEAVAKDNVGAITVTTATAQKIQVTASGGGLAPTVLIKNPLSGDSYTSASKVRLSASAADPDGNLVQVQFYVNGVLVGTANRVATSNPAAYPFSTDWTVGAAGIYTIVAVAQDSSNNRVMSAPVTVTVTGGSNAPTVVLTPAGAGTATVNMPVSLSATAADSDGVVQSVAFYVNGLQISVDNTAPYLASYTPTTAGAYEVTAVALDDNGNKTVSNVYSLTVNTPLLPSIELAAPVPANASLGRPVVLQATATSNVAGISITQVAFYANGVLINTDTAAPYSFSYTPPSSGSYTITAVATDSLGSSKTSTAQTLTVIPVVGIPVQADLLNADLPLTKVATGARLILTVKTTPGNSAVQSVVFSATNGSGVTVTLGQATQISGTDSYQFVYTNALPLDQYQVFAAVTDANGNVARTGQRAIQSVAASAASVTIQSPGNNQTLDIAETTGFERATADVALVSANDFGDKKINEITITKSGLGYAAGSTAILEVVNDSVYASAFGTAIVARSYTLPLTLDGQGRVISIALSGVGDTALLFFQTARITIPDNFGGSSTVPVTLGVTAPSGVSSVSLYANGQLVGTLTNSPYVAQWSPTFAGTYRLHAELVDTNGVLISSSVYTIIVAPIVGYLDSIAVGTSTVYKMVNDYYDTLLLRSVYKAEIAGLNAKFKAGMSDEDIRYAVAGVAVDLVNSDSFRTEGANVILYTMVALQRLPTLAEYQAGLTAIRSVGGQAYLVQLLTGNEYKQKFGTVESILTVNTGQYSLVKAFALRVYQGTYGVSLTGSKQNLQAQNFMNRIVGLVATNGNGPSLVAQVVINYLADQRSGTNKELVESRIRVVGLSYVLRDGTPPTFAEIAARQKISTITIADNFLNNAPLTEGKPIITLQPVGATLPVGQSLLLSVAVRATPRATLQWYRNGAPIIGATSVSYSASTGGQYTLKATNAKGAVTSRVAKVIIVPQVPTVPVGGVSVDLGVSPGISITNGLAGMEYYGKGLPAGLSINKMTGEIIGLVSTKAKLGTYTVSVWSQSDKIKSAVQTFTLVVQPYPAAFKGNKDSGLLTNGSAGTFGSLSMTVSSTGAYTGRLVNTDLTSYTLRGTMVATANNSAASSYVTIPGLGTLQLRFNNLGVLGATLTVGAVVYTN